MHLITRRDTALSVGLIVGTFIVFQQPLRQALDLAGEIEARYHLDLLPALTVLTVLFLLHQGRKRQEARADAAMARVQAQNARAQADESDRLVVLGRVLANARDRTALRQALWEHLPDFADGDERWLLTREQGLWQPLLEDALAAGARSHEQREAVATRAVSAEGERTTAGGLRVDDVECFPMHVGQQPVGVLGIRSARPMDPRVRRSVAAAAGLIAIAIRNVQLFDEIRDHALRDRLTGCFNRTHGLEVLEAELKRARRTGRTPSIIMFDIDHFKAINDSQGHLAGDHVLSVVGRQLHTLLRESDTKCRYGGDEFLLILPETPRPGAEQVAAALAQDIARQAIADAGGAIHITASVGVAHAVSADDATSLIARADEALYQAKRHGRNQVSVAPLPGSASASAQRKGPPSDEGGPWSETDGAADQKSNWPLILTNRADSTPVGVSHRLP